MMVNMLDRDDDDSVHAGRHTKVPILYIELFLAVTRTKDLQEQTVNAGRTKKEQQIHGISPFSTLFHS